jgi:hypothetical protein
MNQPEPLVTSHNRLGETPYLVARGAGPVLGRLGRSVHLPLRTRDGPEFKTYPVSVPVTALARRAAGGWIAVAQDGLYDWDPCVNIYTPFVSRLCQAIRIFAITMPWWTARDACCWAPTAPRMSLRRWVRCISWIPGEPLVEARPRVCHRQWYRDQPGWQDDICKRPAPSPDHRPGL